MFDPSSSLVKTAMKNKMMNQFSSMKTNIKGTKDSLMSNLTAVKNRASISVPATPDLLSRAMADLNTKIPSIVGEIKAPNMNDIIGPIKDCPAAQTDALAGILGSITEWSDIDELKKMSSSFMSYIQDELFAGAKDKLGQFLNDLGLDETPDEFKLASDMLVYDFNLSFATDLIKTINQFKAIGACISDIFDIDTSTDIADVNTVMDDMMLDNTTGKPKWDEILTGSLPPGTPDSMKTNVVASFVGQKIGMNQIANGIIQQTQNPDIKGVSLLLPRGIV